MADDERPDKSHNHRDNSQQYKPLLNQLSSLSYFSNQISQESISEIKKQDDVINYIVSSGKNSLGVRCDAISEVFAQTSQKETIKEGNSNAQNTNIEILNIKRTTQENARKVAQEILQARNKAIDNGIPKQMGYTKLPFARIKDAANMQSTLRSSQNTSNIKQI